MVKPITGLCCEHAEVKISVLSDCLLECWDNSYQHFKGL